MILLSFVSAVLAEPKPTNVPHQVTPGEADWPAVWGAIGTQWMDMSGAAELPAGVMNSDGDDYIRGPVPIGFTFHFMNGPVEPLPGWPPADWKEWWTGETAPPLPENWPSELSDKGYVQVYVADNGYLVMADPQYMDGLQDPNIGHGGTPGIPHWRTEALGPARPNNYIAPFYSDWVIGDNTTRKVTDIEKQKKTCYDDAGKGYPCFEWVPIEWTNVERPRGRLLYKTFGTSPNRVFVVEWQNARNFWSGNLVSFQVQLFEGSNAILFQYKDAMPEEDGRPFFQPGGVIGLEDSFGKTFVGEWFDAGMLNKPGMNWTPAPAPVGDGDQIGFVH